MLLDQLGIASRARHLPQELSAGERQRCAVARALINEPDVILADEPTGNLDEESADRVLEQLATCHASGKTVLIASHHHLDKIQAERTFVLSEGRLETPS
jgi:ABC-type ATPase involved in cell division